ncbi:MAG: Crp/Fnr family transcriptional regulator [Nannocystaceae bacterium]
MAHGRDLGSRSCLVSKLSRFIDIPPSDAELLALLEREERDYDADASVFAPGDRIDELFVVKRGWLYTFDLLPDGGRQIFQCFYPGDIIGMSGLPYGATAYGLQAVADVTLCPFPKRHLDTVLVRSPRLSALLFTITFIEQAVLLDRIRTLGRMSAKRRLAHFVLENLSRMQLMQETDLRDLELPFTQAVIADALGLTNVHVSRTFTTLVNEGLLERDGRRISVADYPALVELADFHDRWSEVDTMWFPGATKLKVGGNEGAAADA